MGALLTARLSKMFTLSEMIDPWGLNQKDALRVG